MPATEDAVPAASHGARWQAASAMTAQLTIGFIVDSTQASASLYNLVRHCVADPALDAQCLILQTCPADPRLGLRREGSVRNDGVSAWVSRLTFRAIVWLEKRLLGLLFPRRNLFSRRDLSELVTRRVTVAPEVADSDATLSYTPQDVEKIRSLKLDVLVACTAGRLCGQIVGAARHGIISGGAAVHAGFWEVYGRADTSEFEVAIRTELGYSVLRRGSIGTKYSYLLNNTSLQERRDVLLLAALRNLGLPGSIPPQGQLPRLEPRPPRPPTWAESLAYAAQLSGRVLAKVSDRLTKSRYRWNVAFSRAPWEDLVPSEGTVIANPEGRFLADPFVLSRGEKDYCFVEDFDDASGKGAISVYELHGGHAQRLGEVLNEPFHMSFPYVFEYNGQLYMCPETSEANQIRLYKNVEFPMKWEFSCVLMDNVSAVDTLLFPKDGAWWMFTNINESKDTDYPALSIFSAPDPLSGLWRPHLQNPVLVEGRGGRNGGLLVSGERIFRPGQCQGFDLYGKSFRIHEMTQLSLRDYKETSVREIHPSFFHGLSGTHHIHSSGRVTVFDVMRKANRWSPNRIPHKPGATVGAGR